jgi:hypothetical protein
MPEITVYRWDEGRKAKDPIGVVFERRKIERGSNYIDLLRLARRRFAADAAGAVHIFIDLGYTRQRILPELTGNCSTG